MQTRSHRKETRVVRGGGYALIIASFAFLMACNEGASITGPGDVATPTPTPPPQDVTTPTPTPTPQGVTTPTPTPTPAETTSTPLDDTVPVIHEFVADPLTIDAGGSSTLSWQVEDAASVEIDHGIGSVSLNGTRSVSPTSTTTYTLTAHGAGGDATATAEVKVNPAPPEACVPEPTLPASGATLDNGRQDGTDLTNWGFLWTPCSGATQYRLYVKHSSALNPFIDITTSEIFYNYSDWSWTGYQTGWSWKVRARINGQWGDWSPARSFKVEPVNSDEQCVPALSTPVEGATLDNGRKDGTEPMVWYFNWQSCTGATNYHLYVIGPTALNPMIDKSDISSSHYRHEVYGWTGQLSGWTWKVRSKINGHWSAWSPTRSFKVEPPDTD